MRELRTDRGSFVVWTVTPRIYASRCIGYFEPAHVELFLPYSERVIAAAPGPVQVFHEWTEMTGYDSSCRQKLTGWTLEKRSSFARIHVSVRSKIVAMGVQVANVALGNIVAYPTAAALQAALRAALAAEA